MNHAIVSEVKPRRNRPDAKTIAAPFTSEGRTFVKKEHQLDAEEYARCLVSPYDHATRIPTAYANKSSLLRTKRTFAITGEQLSAQREFAFFVQPKLGDPSRPDRFQVGLINMSLPQRNLNDVSSYVQYDDTGKSLALDPNSPWITQGIPRALGLRNATVTTQTNPLQGALPWEPSGKKFTYGMPGMRFQALPTAAGSRLTINAGTYLATVRSTSASAPSVLQHLNLSRVLPDGSYSASGITLLMDNGVAASVEQFSQWAITIHEGEYLRVYSRDTAVNLQSFILDLVPLTSPAVAWSPDYGLCETVRPVGMSVLSTCALPPLTAGGIIQSAMLVGASGDKVFDGTWLEANGFSDVDGYFSGPLETGNYMWWRPMQEADLNFRNVGDANAHQYPQMLIKGFVASDVAPSATVMSITIEFVYEIQHNSQLLDRKKRTGSTVVYESALTAISNVPYASENPEHSSLLKQVNRILDTGSRLIPFFTAMMS